LCFATLPALAQVESPIRPPAKDLPVKADSITPIAADTTSINKNDTLKAVANEPKSDIETTIFYSAEDSINSSLDKKMIHLYGGAKVKYGLIELEAEEIVIDYEKSTISANGKLDSLGRRVGFPLFKNGAEEYETRDMVYNFKTKRAKITEVVTRQGDGFLHGEVVFKNDKNELFSLNNAYTTCNLAHPHFRIISKKSKAIPGDKIVSGPFYFEFNNIPTPLLFPFALFPSPKKSSSGIVIPRYGEERKRGFFLNGGGYFFDINEYVKLLVTGSIYSKGSSALNLSSSYNKRYKYSGNVSFSYTHNVNKDKIEAPLVSNDYRIVWSHTPQTVGTGRFSASVNAATSTYNQYNSLGVSTNPSSTTLDNTTRKLSSNIAYSKTFPGTPFSLGVNLRINQDLTTKQMDVPLPDASFNINNIYPFKKLKNIPSLSNFALRLTSVGTNQVTNNLGKIGVNGTDSIAPITLANIPYFFKNSRKGIKFNLPLGTSIKVFKYFTLSPAISFDELWYFDKLDWGLNEDKTHLVVKDTIHGFNTITNYSGGISTTTRFYGMYLFKKGKVQAIRHIINPSVGYSFRPDFGDPKYDYYQRETLANGQVEYQSRHQGYVYGGSGLGKSNALSFSLNNSLEMKVKSPKDSVAKKISLLNTLSASASYNIAADSFKLSTIPLSANTNVLQDKLNINISASLDPYQYVTISKYENGDSSREIRTSSYAWKKVEPIPDYYVIGRGGKLGRITGGSLALGTNLSPKGQKKDTDTRSRIANSDASASDKEFMLTHPEAYVDFTVPWNLRVNYNLDYNKPIGKKSVITQALRFNGDLSLSEKWKVTFNSGYDLEKKAFTQTNIGINRDLHCWQMSMNWVPFGRYQSYTFSIGIKSSLLQSLKLDRNRNFLDGLATN
jgi:hypothetical protein